MCFNKIEILMTKLTIKIEEIELPNKTDSKIEEIIIPKDKTGIDPFSSDEEEYLKYLIDKYSSKN